MDYSQAIDFLLSFADFERSGRFQDRPDVEPVLALLRRLGDPHLGRTTVHIAGSKGKGSVATMVESILRASGYSTGLFTSPHLYSYTERIRINGEPLPKADWARLTGVLREAVEDTRTEGRSLVTFDLLTALAFLAFREREVDCQVLEAGLGGRVDSTNVFETKDICAITAIGLEHTDVLGGTVEAIAGEKAGIMVRGATTVIGPQEHEAGRRVLLTAADSAGCPVVDVAERYSWRLVSHDLDGQTLDLRSARGRLRVRIPLLGEHQMENAATAVASVAALADSGADIPHEAVRHGLAAVSWPCRMEVVQEKPVLVADGAHSRESARRLRETLTRYLSCRNAFLIIGMTVGKDVLGVAQELAPLASEAGVFAVRAGHPRAMAPEEVAAAFARAGVQAQVSESVAAALDEALAKATGEGVICLAGSLFVAAEGRAHLQGIAVTA